MSKPKPGARKKLTADLKARALDVWAIDGTTAAAKLADVTPRTVNRWAKAAGLTPPEERAAQTAAAQAEVARRQAIAYANLLPELTHIAERSLAAQLELSSLAAEVLAVTREGAEIPVKLAGRLRAAAALVEALPARVLVAMSTRAIHDLQLLTGGDTERASGEVRVFLAKLDDTAPPLIIDVSPVVAVRDAS